MDKLNIQVDLFKIDELRRLISGVATSETPDHSGEIMDYAVSKPHFLEWSSKIRKNSRGKSKGNLRAMHSAIAAGLIKDMRFDDFNKKIEITAEVVDDNEWKKVLKGVYTGFSIGGSYGKKWRDGAYQRYEALPTEISLADYPQNPDSVIELVKKTGEIVQLKKHGSHDQKTHGHREGRPSHLPAKGTKYGDWKVDETDYQNEHTTIYLKRGKRNYQLLIDPKGKFFLFDDDSEDDDPIKTGKNTTIEDFLKNFEKLTKGGPGSGEKEGHPFRGNQYTVRTKRNPANPAFTQYQVIDQKEKTLKESFYDKKEADALAEELNASSPIGDRQKKRKKKVTLKDHPMFTKEDYEYLSEKGYEDQEILDIWTRDLKAGKSPTRVNKDKERLKGHDWSAGMKIDEYGNVVPDVEKLAKGESEGHPFRGNQYVDAGGKGSSPRVQEGAGDSSEDFPVKTFKGESSDKYAALNQSKKLMDKYHDKLREKGFKLFDRYRYISPDDRIVNMDIYQHQNKKSERKSITQSYSRKDYSVIVSVDDLQKNSSDNLHKGEPEGHPFRGNQYVRAGEEGEDFSQYSYEDLQQQRRDALDDGDDERAVEIGDEMGRRDREEYEKGEKERNLLTDADDLSTWSDEDLEEEWLEGKRELNEMDPEDSEYQEQKNYLDELRNELDSRQGEAADEEFMEMEAEDEFEEPTGTNEFVNLMLDPGETPLQGRITTFEEGGYLTHDRGVVYRNPNTHQEFQFTVRHTTSVGDVSDSDVEEDLINFFNEGFWPNDVKIRDAKDAGYWNFDGGVELTYPDRSKYVIDIRKR